MALFQLDSAVQKITPIPETTFQEEAVLERAHLQAALRDHIQALDLGLYVITEEFGDFEGANRRVDLLCVNRAGNLVVVELKRTADGGHVELQALRYAAMLSTMTANDVLAAHVKYRQDPRFAPADRSPEAAEGSLRAFLGVQAPADLPNPDDRPQIVLVSHSFSTEVTTTVLWLNREFGMDIRCVRWVPYRDGSQLLLDIQTIIPLPEAADMEIKIKSKETARLATEGRIRADAKVTGEDLLAAHQAGDRGFLAVGRNGGLAGASFQNDLATGDWRTWSYEVSRLAEAAQQRNWFTIDEFIQAVGPTADLTPAPAQGELDPAAPTSQPG